MSKDWRVTFRTRNYDRKTDSTCRIRFFRLLFGLCPDEMPISATWHVLPQRFDRMVNIPSQIYHFPGQRFFGCTKDGKFMCQQDADHEGDRPTRNEQCALHTGSTCAIANGSN